MVLLFSIACIFLIISYYDTRFFYPLYLIYVAFISNNTTLTLFNLTVSSSWLYIAVMLISLSCSKTREKLSYHSLYLTKSKAAIIAYLASFLIPLTWNYFYFNVTATDFLINHIYAGITAYIFSFLTYKKNISLKNYFDCFAKVGLALILVIAPQSLYFFYKSGGGGFGRFRSSEIIEIPYVWTYRINEETILFKTTTHGSYLLSFFSAILISAVLIKYFKSNKKKVQLICICTLFVSFITIYVNQYLSTTLIFVINALFGASFCFYISPQKNFKSFFPLIISLLLVVITITPSAKINKYIKKINGSIYLTEDLLIAQVDLLQQLQIMQYTQRESLNRITLLYDGLEKLKRNQLLTKGIGLPKHIDLSNNPQIEASRHTLGFDYIIYFGIFIGGLVILMKLFSFLYEAGNAYIKKPFELDSLYIINGSIALALLFFIGRMDYYKWSLLCLLGLWVTPFIHSKMSGEIEMSN